MHGSNPIIVMFNEIKKLVFSRSDDRDIQLIDDAWCEEAQNVVVPVISPPANSRASIVIPIVGDSGVLGVVPKVLAEGYAGDPIFENVSIEDPVISWEI